MLKIGGQRSRKHDTYQHEIVSVFYRRRRPSKPRRSHSTSVGPIGCAGWQFAQVDVIISPVYQPEGREGAHMATTRRGLLGGFAGIAFVTCAPTGEARSQERPPRREIVINGRRVRTIDVHAHCAVPEAMALMGLKVSPEALAISQDRIRAMDEQGIDLEALSINPYWYNAERDLVEQIIKLQNEKLAEICAEQPERFVAFGTVALQYPDLAAEQLEIAVKKLGLRGTLIGGSVNGEELSDAKFDPFWANAEELGALIFIHPQGTAELAGRIKGNGGLTNVIGNPLETTIALSHLIFEGTLDRGAGGKIGAAQGGGRSG